MLGGESLPSGSFQKLWVILMEQELSLTGANKMQGTWASRQINQGY